MIARDKIKKTIRRFSITYLNSSKLKKLFYRIVTARAEWVAPNKAFNGQDDPTEKPMTLDRLNGIGRTGRVKPTCRRKQGGYNALIETNNKNID